MQYNKTPLLLPAMLMQSVQPRILITRDGLLAVALLVLAVIAWAVLLTGLGAVLLIDNLHASLASWIDGLQIHLPMVGRISGEALLTRVIDKLAMLSFAIIPVLLLETAIVGARDSSLWRLFRGRSISSLNDLAIYGLNLLGLWKYACIVLTFGTVFIVNLAAGSIVGATAHFQLRIHTGSLVADAALALLVFTFCDYWNHRLQHMNPLWPLHRIHHAAEEMTVLTLWRQHPSISAIEPFIKLWPLALFDVPAQAVAVAGMVIIAYEHLIHSNLRWDWGWFGRWVLLPPTAHRLHHYVDPVCQGKNFGIPVIWDRLFGTWDGRAPPGERLGIADVPYNLGHPFREVWRDLTDFSSELGRWATRIAGRGGH
jgi:sterol desaturase/sphingolipid hydroxylase (fatty acid hydroxylase superfamily)